MIGSGRLPTFEDREGLVYVNAIVKEMLRWFNVTPLGVSHRTMEDDELNGYFIPKGSMVMANTWCVPIPISLLRSIRG